jgi:hypothetical protein
MRIISVVIAYNTPTPMVPRPAFNNTPSNGDLPSNDNAKYDVKDFPTTKKGNLRNKNRIRPLGRVDDDMDVELPVETRDVARQIKVKLFCGALHEDEIRDMPRDLIVELEAKKKMKPKEDDVLPEYEAKTPSMLFPPYRGEI